MIHRNEITCVVKDEIKNPYEKILSVGGSIQNVRWEKTLEEVVKDIEAEQCVYFVSRFGCEVEVVVGTGHYGNKYIKTKSDTDTPANLLSLPECPL